MSSYPPEPSPPEPGAQANPPAAGWSPTPLSSGDQPGYAGTARPEPPSNAAPAETFEIARYAPRRSLLPFVLTAIGLVVAVLVAYTATRPAAVSPTPTPRHSATPSHAPSVDGTPFVESASGATGVWKVLDSRWDDNGLAVFIQLTVDTEDFRCYFNALSHDGQDIVRGSSDEVSPGFPTTALPQGQQVRGWVYFPIERSTTLVFLRTSDQAQISAIEVSG